MFMPTLAQRIVPVSALALAATMATSGVATAADDHDRISLGNTTVETWQEVGTRGDVSDHFQVTIDGRTTGPQVADYRIHMRDLTFDPLRAVVPAPAVGLAADADVHMYLVQYVTNPLAEYRADVEDLGGIVRWYVPYHAQVVEMDADQAGLVADLPYVRWVGTMHPQYRIDPDVRDAYLTGAVVSGQYNVMVWEGGLGMKTAVAQQIRALGGTVTLLDAGKFLLRARLTGDQIAELAYMDEVAFIDPWGPMEPDMNIARQLMGADWLETAAGYDGEGVTGEVIDVGFNTGHGDFASRPLILHSSVASASHGASTSGIIFGDGTGNPMYRGLLPMGQGIIIDSGAMTGAARYNDIADLLEAPYYASFQSSSVGSPRTFFYDSTSADLDAALFDHDFTLCQSQSNSGTQDSRPQAWAKNVISVGGINHHGTLTMADDNWAGASIGPASDGRLKPDLNSFYDQIGTVTSGGSTSYTTSFGGTSGATPIVAGHVGLLHDMWSDGIFGNEVDPGGTPFDNRPHAATTKAMMINTARQYTFSGTSHNLTRVHQGWGMPDMQYMYEQREKMLVINESDIMLPSQTSQHFVTVLEGEPEFRATMVYADPPGLPPYDIHRINDLSLRVTSPGGTVYWGNNGLNAGNYSVAGGGNNDRDTVENVLVQNPEPGGWLVEVIAMEINQDSHVETGELDADYALVVSGVIPELPAVFFRLESSIPELLPPGEPLELTVSAADAGEILDPASITLHYRMDPADPFSTMPATPAGGENYVATVPGAGCDDTPEFYLSAASTLGSEVFLPSTAPASLYAYTVGEDAVIFTDDFEAEQGWAVTSETLFAGEWERAVPSGGGLRRDPPTDYDGSGSCYLTQDGAGDTDVDGGPTMLTSPVMDMTGLLDPYIEYARWFRCDDAQIPDQADAMVVEVSNDDGSSWTLVEEYGGDVDEWELVRIRVSDFVAPTDQVRIRFSVDDTPSNSITEAGIDAVRLTSYVCLSCSESNGDTNGDGVVDVVDLLEVLSTWGACGTFCPADFDCSGAVDIEDLLILLANWT